MADTPKDDRAEMSLRLLCLDRAIKMTPEKTAITDVVATAILVRQYLRGEMDRNKVVAPNPGTLH